MRIKFISGVFKMKSFLLTLKTEKAKKLIPEITKPHKKVIIHKIAPDKYKYIFTAKIMSTFINVDSFIIMLKKFGLDLNDFEVSECH